MKKLSIAGRAITVCLIFGLFGCATPILDQSISGLRGRSIKLLTGRLGPPIYTPQTSGERVYSWRYVKMVKGRDSLDDGPNDRMEAIDCKLDVIAGSKGEIIDWKSEGQEEACQYVAESLR